MTLKSQLKPKIVKNKMLRWQLPAYILCFLGVAIITFTIFQFCYKDWEYNYSYKIITAIDSLDSETQKNTLHGLMYAPLIGLWMIISFCWKRIGYSDEKTNKRKEFENQFENDHK